MIKAPILARVRSEEPRTAGSYCLGWGLGSYSLPTLNSKLDSSNLYMHTIPKPIPYTPNLLTLNLKNSIRRPWIRNPLHPKPRTITPKGPKDPIIRYSALGQQLCRLGFWRLFDYQVLGPLGSNLKSKILKRQSPKPRKEPLSIQGQEPTSSTQEPRFLSNPFLIRVPFFLLFGF